MSGSAISARVIPTASAAPEATSSSASSKSTIRVVAITAVAPAASRASVSFDAIAFSATGGGGAIQVEPA